MSFGRLGFENVQRLGFITTSVESNSSTLLNYRLSSFFNAIGIFFYNEVDRQNKWFSFVEKGLTLHLGHSFVLALIQLEVSESSWHFFIHSLSSLQLAGSCHSYEHPKQNRCLHDSHRTGRASDCCTWKFRKICACKSKNIELFGVNITQLERELIKNKNSN